MSLTALMDRVHADGDIPPRQNYFLLMTCSNLSISVIDYYTSCEVFGLLRVYFTYGFCIGLILIIVLWDIAQAALLQLLACKEPPCDGVEAQ
jgi:hypothetical protein